MGINCLHDCVGGGLFDGCRTPKQLVNHQRGFSRLRLLLAFRSDKYAAEAVRQRRKWESLNNFPGPQHNRGTHGHVPSCRVLVKHTETWVEPHASERVVQRLNDINTKVTVQ